MIRHFRTASLILGRSGTGKTTCLVMKLARKYLASKEVMDERPARQVSNRVEVLSLSAADLCQVLLTRSPYLADKIGPYARRLIKTLSHKSPDLESFQQNEQALVMTAEDHSETEDVSTLRDHSFPLICSWDHFLRLLENSTVVFDRQNFLRPLENQSKGFASTGHRYHSQTVDGYAFQLDYWPRLPHTLTKDFSVGLVFAEIMGIIKGSASSRDTLAPLQRNEYLLRSCRLAPNFVLETERSRVYDIFEKYETLKISRGDVDYVDRVVRILKAVRQDPSLKRVLRTTFDEIYIDEIQDQRCIDIELLLSFVRDGRSFHFAGDTAQAISQDSTFRFSDIKDIFFQHFAPTSTSTNQRELARPEMFVLSKNYRSHQGILALASLVMGLIWQGFPDTVDKLQPETGNVNGPKPVLFVGVDYKILLFDHVDNNHLTGGTAEFGAEQVILVRDTNTKSSLQGQIGDTALVLTVPESKGMEFDDVILWDFFTGCSDQAGVRSLNALKNEPAKFDPRIHAGMCSELKHLYVAITRARVHLYIMESSESTAASVQKFLSQDASETLVEVTGPHHGDFQNRLDTLRAEISMDPQKWHRRATEFLQRRMYTAALRYFRKAEDTRGEATAEAYVEEEYARRCDAGNDTEGFIRHFENAVQLFEQADLFEEAARALTKLGRLQDAAELYFEHQVYTKASTLFAKVGLYAKAASCHTFLKQYSEAADMLRRGNHFDQLVAYLDKHAEEFPTSILRGYSLLCKLLLKQKRISPECRSHAIRLLGSSHEQEECFIEYRMDEELAELYTEQKRHKHLYDLLSRAGQLERALNLSLCKDLSQSFAGVAESELLKLLDYVCAGQVMKNRRQDSAAAFRIRSDHLPPNIAHRIEQWDAGHRVYSDQGSSACQKLADMEASVATKTLTLQKIMDATAIPKITTLDDMPFEMMQKAIAIAKDLVLKNDKNALSIVLILTGVWTIGGRHEKYVLLPWSPLHGALDSLSTTDFPRVAKGWVLDNIASTVLALNSRARVLWNSKWRVRCSNYLSTGKCRQHNCQQVHENLSHDDCSRILEDILRVNSFFCDLAPLYYQRVMSTTFQQNYLGIRRYWLERLLRELTFLSNTEQSAPTIAKIRTELLLGDKSLPVRSSLEGLLYFKLGTEWKDRSDFTALLEQMQISDAFGMFSVHVYKMRT